MSVKTLIDRASAKVGTRYKLAKLLGVSPAQVYDWEAGRKPCPAEDRARIAGFAGEDAVQELVRATIEQAKGEVRKAQLEKLLGKLLHQTGEALHTVAVPIASLTFLMSMGNELLHTMYRKVKFPSIHRQSKNTPKPA